MARRSRFANAVLVVSVPVMVAAACGGGTATVPMHGTVTKTVGRACALLSAAIPGVDHRVVSFTDEVGSVIGRAVTGRQRVQGIGSTGCRMSASFAVDLPVRHSYAANVSSQVTTLPPSPSIDFDTLAARGWRFDVAIPATG